MSKLFASDLDGTLLNILHSTDFIILHVIKKIIKKGHYFTIATGRNMRVGHIRHSFKDIPVYCIAMNGAIILKDDKIIYEKIIDKDVVKELLMTFPDINFEFITNDKIYTKTSEEILNQKAKNLPFFVKLLYRRYQKAAKDEYIYKASDEMILSQDILKINCNINDNLIAKRFNEYLEINQDKIVNAPFNNSTYEITMHNVSKASAIKYLASLLKIDDNDIYVYGDGKNDIRMLETFKNSYAPNNASIEARNVAHHIIGNNNLYSVIKHMNKIIKN